jgi:predicted PurR-regulated permease PerM
MNSVDKDLKCRMSGDLKTELVKIGLVVSLVYLCARVFSPFMDLLLWALILAVALFPLHQGLAKKLKGKQARAATLLILAGLLLVGVPMTMLGSSFVDHISESYTSFQNGTLTIKEPSPAIAEWPIVGKKIYKGWSKAAEDLPGYMKKYEQQLKAFSKKLFASALNTTKGLLLFLVSLIIAGIMLAYGESGIRSMGRIFNRVAGPIKGPELQGLSTATIRSVANGVIGVAFIQALLLGVGFLLAGVPAAGVLALVILFVGIAQLPAIIITLPVIAYIWSVGDASTASNIFFTIYLVAAGTSDAFLKPILLGRGVDAPMPIILIGALGGMVTAGIIGLFVGAVVLTIGYKIFMAWVNDDLEPGNNDQANEN